jgi:hypothetical protein
MMKFSSEHLANLSKASKHMWKNPRYREKRRIAMLGNTNGRGTLDGHSNLGQKRPAISKVLTGRKLSPEHCEAISKGNLGKKKTPQHCANIRKGLIGNKNGVGHIPCHNRTYNVDLGHYIRSGWEEDVCKFLKDSKILYRYEATKFFLGRNRGHSWTPDIEFNPQLYLEIKGYLTKEANWQIPRFLQEHPDKTLILLSGSSGAKKFKRLRKRFTNSIFLSYDKEKEWQPKLLEILKTRRQET